MVHIKPLFLQVCALAATCLCASVFATGLKVGNIEIERPYTWEMPPGSKVGGAFMVIHNRGKTADRLLRASTPIAGTTELHTHVKTLGVMRMRAVDEIVIEPEQSVVLKPGSFHLMFFDVKQVVKAGERFPVTLEFEKAGKTTIQVEVEPREVGQSNSSHSGPKH